MNLVKVIQQINSDIKELKSKKEKEINKITKQYDEKINNLKTALKINMELNTTCLECEGRGTVSFCDASGNTDRERCNICLGSGKVQIANTEKKI